MIIYIYVMLIFAFSDRELVVIWILILFDLPYRWLTSVACQFWS